MHSVDCMQAYAVVAYSCTYVISTAITFRVSVRLSFAVVVTVSGRSSD